MKLSSRERIFLACLPALAFLGVHLWIIQPKLEDRVNLAAFRLKNASGSAADTISAMEDDIDAKRDALRNEQNRVKALTEKKASLLAHWSTTESRTTTVRELTALFERGKLSVVRSASDNDDPTVAQPNAGAREVVTTMKDLGGPSPEVLRFDLEGSWGQFLTAMREVSQLATFAVPVAFTIRLKAKGADQLEFSVWCWI